ncbi:MAG: hypothetical protein AAGI66_09960 [Cyanobacteria bacterium P01_H01_bin.74]
MIVFISKLRNKQTAKKGQGVIEYAGALVIAAVLVAAVLAIGPDGISTLFTNILTSVQTYFTGQLPSA